jgi:hypothetical protein
MLVADIFVLRQGDDQTASASRVFRGDVSYIKLASRMFRGDVSKRRSFHCIRL